MTPDDTLHADYLSAAGSSRWKGRLDMLFMELRAEARARQPTRKEIEENHGWMWRVLPRGAFVGMRHRSDLPGDRYELRIARRGQLEPEDQGLWETEISTLLDQFQIRESKGEYPALVPGGHWCRLANGAEGASTAVRFLSLMPGEIRPGRARCHDCALEDPPQIVEIEWNPSYSIRGQRCPVHAVSGQTRDVARAAVQQEFL